MRLVLDNSSGISLNQQIKMQLRYLIANGDLPVGSKLPSIRELALFLGTNRNTVAKAYKELAQEGNLAIIQAKGAFVTKPAINPDTDDRMKLLVGLIQKSMHKAGCMGFSVDDFLHVVQTLYLKQKSKSQEIRILFFECNQYALDQYVKDLSDALQVKVEGILLSNIPQLLQDREKMSRYDLFVTTAGHYPHVSKYIDSSNLYGINLGAYLKLVERLLECPADTNIGVICMAGIYGSEDLRQALLNFGIRPERVSQAGIEDSSELKQLIDNNDVLIVSKFARMARQDLFAPLTSKVIIEYENILSESSINILKKVIEKTTAEKNDTTEGAMFFEPGK